VFDDFLDEHLGSTGALTFVVIVKIDEVDGCTGFAAFDWPRETTFVQVVVLVKIEGSAQKTAVSLVFECACYLRPLECLQPGEAS
jgi:hypothetical protein